MRRSIEIMRYGLMCFLLMTLCSLGGYAQKAEREYLRKGNKAFNDSAFVNAEVYYRKAIEVNPKSATAMYNLGNTLSQEQKFEEAMEQYQAAARLEKNKNKLSQIHHNGGVIFQAGQDYAKAIEMYKEALRNNPHDDETRYNLALAQYLLENDDQGDEGQDQNEDNQDDQQDQNQDQPQNQDQQQDQQDQDQQQNENEMSRENAEQLLNSVMQDEKDIQDKVKQKQVIRGKELDKDW